MSGGNAQPSGPGVRRDLEEFLSSAVLTQEVDFSGGATPAPATGGTGGAGGSPSRQAAAAIRQVLGYRPRTADPKGFVSALNSVFSGQDVGGYTEFTYVPRSYAAEMQTDFGALTGAQASLYTRAKAAVDQSLPLLDGLYPLRPDADTEDCEATRATVRQKLTELVSELGVLGGPRLARVDDLFRILLGDDDVVASSDALASQPNCVLAQMQTFFGFTRSNVNDIDDEQDLTNFLIVVDYALTLRGNWEEDRAKFRRSNFNTDTFLGTQLVLISQQLAVVAEEVQETIFAMDSVFLGPAERQTTVLQFDGFHRPLEAITISELFDWITTVVTVEVPQAIEQSGKLGIIPMFPTLRLLRDYVRATAHLARGTHGRQSPKFTTVRVARAVEDLRQCVDGLVALAEGINLDGPRISSATYAATSGLLTVQATGVTTGYKMYLHGIVDTKDPSHHSIELQPTPTDPNPNGQQTIQAPIPSSVHTPLDLGGKVPVTVEIINLDLQRDSLPVVPKPTVAPPPSSPVGQVGQSHALTVPATTVAPPPPASHTIPVVIEKLDGVAIPADKQGTITVTGLGVNLLSGIELHRLDQPGAVVHLPVVGPKSVSDTQVTFDVTTDQNVLLKQNLRPPIFLRMKFVADPNRVTVVVTSDVSAILHIT
jgi:hypothetical protein